MKTAVSLPDPVFEAAEKLAKRMKLSRSAFYSLALEEFVKRNQTEDLTAEINRVLGEIGQKRDPSMDVATRATFKRSEWDE